MAELTIDFHKVIKGEQDLRTLINHIDDPIWLVDPDFNIVECNEAFKLWVSYFIGCELNRGDNVLYDGKDKIYFEKFETCYQLAMNGRAFKSVEDIRINNQLHYTYVTFNPVFDSNKKIIGVSCFARDITESRQHLLKIEEQNTALREIAFIESHKVRGPVATIMGLEQMFNYENPADPENAELMMQLKQVIKQLDTIIREVVRKSNEIGLQP